ncbi:MAG: exodeoxyribonuclease VII small subunit [Anaerolineae bacterium]
MDESGAPSESFEAAFAELEATVRRLEEGNLPLAEALALYERGVHLSERCRQYLDAAELRIQQLSAREEDADDEEALEPVYDEEEDPF